MLIVVIPITAVAVLVADVTGNAEAGKADAQVATGLSVALGLYERRVDEAESIARSVLRDPAVRAAAIDGSPDAVAAALEEAAAGSDLTFLQATTGDGSIVSVVGSGEPFAAAPLRTTGDAAGLEVLTSVTRPEDFVREVQQLTDLDAVLEGDGFAASTTAEDVSVPAGGEPAEVELGGDTARAGAIGLSAPGGGRIGVFAEVEPGGFFDSQPRVAAALALFIAAAIFLIGFVVRSLQGQVASMLEAARRIGAGDFSRRVPVRGADEMAGLAREFNKMTEQLEAHIEQLQRQQKDLDRTVQRLGQAFASGLDRDALLAIVADTVRESCSAEYCRIMLVDGILIENPEGLRGTARDAAVAGERRSRRELAKVVARRDDGHALSAPLRRMGQGDISEGTISIARHGIPFSEAERNMFLYLLGQAAASLENITTHERVSELAVTDELTGLPNSRAFREAIEREAARAERFGHELSLVILDLDDFKQVNDTYGHLQGDEVLRTVGRVLESEPRAIDEPARYGGEEFVVALPETSTEGAIEIAERIRSRLEGESIPLLEGDGEIQVTASFGVATMPVSADNLRDLFSVADEALYEAKRSGKNRVVGAQARRGALSAADRR